MATINPLVVDLSHHDAASDYARVKAAGIVGVIFKATEGATYTDPTYVEQQKAAKMDGLLWGAYHFADASSVNKQIDNFMRFACPDPDELFCLDWEDNPSGGGKMSVADAKTWIAAVETELKRPGECVIYSGNTAKEALGNTVDAFFGARRLWLCQYSANPVCQKSWKKYWLWQFTDGASGPSPHSIPGIGNCDINSYDGSAAQLAVEWATGGLTLSVRPAPPEQPVVPAQPPLPLPPAPVATTIEIVIIAPPGVTVKIKHAVETPIT